MQKELSGIELLRKAVHILNNCDESFNQRFDEKQLLNIVDCMLKCDMDLYPDQWEKPQIMDAAYDRIVPRWDDDGKSVYNFPENLDNVK